MYYTRIAAAAFVLQGLVPLFLVGMLRPGSLLPWLVATLCVLVARGLWKVRCWALRLEFILSFSQLLGVSSSFFSWRFLVAANIGFGLDPVDPLWRDGLFSFVLNTRFFTFSGYGEQLDYAFLQPSPSLVASFSSLSSESFLFVNGVALVFLFLLMAAREEFVFEGPGTSPSPQRTPAVPPDFGH